MASAGHDWVTFLSDYGHDDVFVGVCKGVIAQIAPHVRILDVCHLIAAQDVHRLYGGVVPELASRAHLELLPPMVERALAEAGVSPDELTGVAVTHAPGLVGSLVVGVAFAKAYAGSLGLPLVGVNHIEAHLHSASPGDGDDG